MYSEEIDSLVEKADKAFALRLYDEAAEHLSVANEKFTEEHGTEDPKLLYLYGRALFRVAVAHSDALGEQQAVSELALEESDKGHVQLGGRMVEKGLGGEEPTEQDDESGHEDEGDQEEKDGQDEDQHEEEEIIDDLQTAWEVLDVSRTLFLKLEQTEETQKQLADVYDVLGEISLEAENFGQAVEDLSRSLGLRVKLYPKGSRLVSEGHFKLSLALEYDFSQQDNRQKALEEMVKAVESVRLQADTDASAKDLLGDLEVRLEELRASTEAQAKATADQKAAIGDMVGQTSELRKQVLDTLAGATSIDGLVRKKRKTDK